jgi:uncharacterized membrane protein
MGTLFSKFAVSFVALALLSRAALADRPVSQRSRDKTATEERTVFVTGSLIPQRIKLKAIGTTTVSPVRIIDRREIDSTGRRTTRGVLIADPAISTTGR